jgi:glycerol transport system ATP-binding protein
VTEITGSESFVHVDVAFGTGDVSWVALLRGVVDLPPGRAVQVHVHPSHVMAFDAGGRFVPAMRLEAVA